MVSSPERPGRPRRGWIWFFLILVVLTATAIVIELLFGRSQQLTAERLAAAKALWRVKGPRDYDMTYTARKNDATDSYEVRVRGGRVVSALRNESPIEEAKYRYQDMNALFGFIEDFWEEDHKPDGPRTYVTAVFDAADGHLLRYIRLDRTTRAQLEIQVKLRLPGEGGKT